MKINSDADSCLNNIRNNGQRISRGPAVPGLYDLQGNQIANDGASHDQAEYTSSVVAPTAWPLFESWRGIRTEVAPLNLAAYISDN